MSDWLWITTYVRPWLLTIFSAGTLGMAVQFYRSWRKGRSDDFKTEVDEADGIRDHYAAELAALRAQIIASGTAHVERQRISDERYQASLKAADEREEHCQRQVRELREEVRTLSDEVIGLRRQLVQGSRSAIVLATHTPTDTILQSAERAAAALDGLPTSPKE